MRLGDLPAYRSYQLAYARGDLAAAEEALRLAIGDARSRKDVDLHSFLLRCLASVLAKSGKLESARSVLDEATSLSVSSPEAAMMTASAWLNVVGDAGSALAKASDLVGHLSSREDDKRVLAQALALKGRCLAELGDVDAARSCMLELEALSSLGVVEHALELCEYLLRDSSSRTLARSYLAEMLAGLERSREDTDDLRRHVKGLLESHTT